MGFNNEVNVSGDFFLDSHSTGIGDIVACCLGDVEFDFDWKLLRAVSMFLNGVLAVEALEDYRKCD
jgi:hypothetical protein